MTVIFKSAVRENVPLLIGLAGGTGSGKTYTAMELATGLSGGKPFAFIDTENNRAKHYADRFKFDHADMRAPFRPERYIEHIQAADKAGYGVVVIDSASHIWAGDGGILDWQEEELTSMAADDWKKREACKMAAWIKPKMAHKDFVSKLLQVNAHVIMCFRAEEKIEMVRENGKMKIIPKESLTGLQGWMPVCEKNLPFELTMSLLFTADAAGVPKPIKLQEQHRGIFDLTQKVNAEAGRKLAEWSRGGTPKERDLLKEGDEAAKGGIEEYKAWFTALSYEEKKKIEHKHEGWKKAAADADEANKFEESKS
jgi:hypothetical protein